MFLDLWSLAILTGDLLELIVNHIESGTLSVSLPFLLFLIVFAAVGAFAWRSTYIPDLPPAPRPPYVIQISSAPTAVYVNGERNTLADVRLLSSGPDVDNVLRRFPHHHHQGVNRIHLGGLGLINPINISNITRPTATVTVQQHSHSHAHSHAQPQPRASLRVYPQNPQQQTQTQRQDGNGTATATGTGNPNNGGSSVLLGYLRPGSVIRPFIGNRPPGTGNQAQNLIVYHRVNVYHHHHHHHHPSTGNTAETSDQTPSPSTSSSEPLSQDIPMSSLQDQNQSSSVDSSTSTSTQFDNHNQGTLDPDAEHQHEGHDHMVTNPVEIEVPPININMNSEDGEEITLHSSSAEESGSNVNVNNEGLRHRSTINRSSATANQSSESENRDTNTTRDTDASERVLRDGETESNSKTHAEVELGLEADPELRSHQTTTTTTSEPVQSVNDLRFTIKFLNDTQKEVRSQGDEKILDFKRRHFATELSENKTVRLIFNGRVLDNDTSTLRESGIFDQCVVHCLIVARPTAGGVGNAGSEGAGAGSGGLNQGTTRRVGGGLVRGTPEPGMFFVSFVGVFLIFLWFICFHFGQHLFTQSAVVSLTVLTAIFLIGLVAFYLPVHPNPN